MIVSGNQAGWFVSLLSGSCLCIFIWQMISPAELAITPTSIRLKSLGATREWCNC